jgi:phenylacetate-CoA ligase
MDWFARVLSASRAAARERRAAQYAPVLSESDRLGLQLQAFNRCWEEIQVGVPFYRRLVADGRAPRVFASWEEFTAVLPVTDRPFLYKHFSELADERRAPQYYRVTGGSTAAPIQLPAWKSELAAAGPDMWWGRSWYGIEPGDRLFLFWGHRHLLGTGWQGFKNAQLRRLEDRLRGYTRHPAYDLSGPALAAAGRALAASGAQYVVGYAVALDRLAREWRDRPLRLARPLKAVIATAESFPFADSAAVAAEAFAAPVGMEYGAVETNLIAHTEPAGDFRVFWRNYLLEAGEPGPSGGRVLRVTSLFPRCFPLIRYEIGDEIVTERPGLGLERFARVLGRCNDYLEFPDGLRLHSEVVTHCLSGVKEISGYQMAQTEGRLVLRLTLRGPLGDAEKDGIRSRLGRLHPRLAAAEIEVVDALERTIAGKTPMIVRPRERKG